MEILKLQQWHILLLAVLLFLLHKFTFFDTDIVAGELFGISTFNWYYIAIASPIIHQLFVLICWRLELYHQSISKTIGKSAFSIYKVGFAILILSRPITITLLALSNAETFNLDSFSTYTFALLLFIPSAYLFYSVKRYFGINRAFGEDHFKIEKYRNQSLIKKGIFKYTSNGMYVYGFLILYVPGILLHSKAAILIAIFNHLYIWVHYYFTEQPDMNTIYKTDN